MVSSVQKLVCNRYLESQRIVRRSEVAEGGARPCTLRVRVGTLCLSSLQQAGKILLAVWKGNYQEEGERVYGKTRTKCIES